jgi:hypothetical protein
MSGTEPESPTPSGPAYLPAPVTPLEPAEPFAPPQAPAAGSSGNPYRRRFLAVYIVLGIVLLLATAGLAGYLFWQQSQTSWSSWRPKASDRTTMATEIGTYIENRYQFASGISIAGVTPGSLSQTNPPIDAIAVPSGPGNKADVSVIGTDNTVAYNFCPTGSTQCAFPATTNPDGLRRLIRREMLETALLTFKYVPGVDSVVAFIGDPNPKDAPFLLFYRKSDLAPELAQPLDKTLALAEPPIAPANDPIEAKTIDRLTIPNGFVYHFSKLQSAGALMVLNATA